MKLILLPPYFQRKFFKRIIIHLLILLALLSAGDNFSNAQTSFQDDLIAAPKISWPPSGSPIRCQVSRDTFVSSIDDERFGNNGREKKLKIKGQQEYTLFDIDASPLRGKVIDGALLHIRSATPKEEPLARIGVSSLASRWIEGTSKRYQRQNGSSSFSQAEYQKRDWAYTGSTLMDVTFGRGHTIWKFAECSSPDQNGWQTCAVDADILAARSAGLSYGFSVCDEVGNIWSLKSGEFKYTWFPNRLCYSRESGASGPWMEVWFKGEDSLPPEKISAIEVDTQGVPAGEALVRWRTPADSGGGKTLGFQVTYRRGNTWKEIPRYLVPMASKTEGEVLMHIQDLSFEPGEMIDISVRAVDSAGNVGPPYSKRIRLSSNPGMLDIPESAPIKPFSPSTKLPVVGGVKVAVIDLLDKIDPKSGTMIPVHRDGYKGGNHIYSAKNKRIRLQSARNETVAFQLNLEGTAQNIDVHFSFDQNQSLKPKIYQFAYVKILNKNGKIVGMLPDPLIQTRGPFSLPSSSGQIQIPDQTNHSLLCEVYVPHQEPPGVKRGRVIISVGSEKLILDVDMTVWNFTLPNKLSFIPEMNSYAAMSPFESHEYYRLAHEHRTCLNQVPYNWKGIPILAPKWKGHDFDWLEWDQKISPLLDGSAFKDLPRAGEPVDVFYLPFNENWPVKIFDNYTPSYWADEAFTAQYKNDLRKAFLAFAKHCADKNWNDTIFQYYLNNKVYNRKKDNRSSAPWVFDEPINTQDFWALRWYGILWNLSINPVRDKINMWFRADISYTQFARNILWGVTDIEYVGGNNIQKIRMKHDEQVLSRKSYYAEYGIANKVNTSNTIPVIWCIGAWTRGAMGVLPWQTIGGKDCWNISQQTALFYPHIEGPKPSVRLKSFHRGQQDVEYLTILSYAFKQPKYVVAAWLRKLIALEETGRIHRSEKGDVEKLWEMRCRLGNMISVRAPVYRRVFVDLKTPVWNPQSLPGIGYVSVAPENERYRPVCDNFRPE